MWLFCQEGVEFVISPDVAGKLGLLVSFGVGANKNKHLENLESVFGDSLFTGGMNDIST